MIDKTKINELVNETYALFIGIILGAVLSYNEEIRGTIVIGFVSALIIIYIADKTVKYLMPPFVFSELLSRFHLHNEYSPSSPGNSATRR